jgi:methanogenic corrinoid protein MtbC1
MRTITPSDVEEYLETARVGDHRSATRLALGFLDDGVPPNSVIEDLLVVAQRETGLRWLITRWNVADEHAVTTTTAAVIEVLAMTATHGTDRGNVVVVCAEGDWHSMPSRLCAQQLRARGWNVRILGASTPADHLAEYLNRTSQDGLIISCALPLHYAGAARLADVARQHAIPALIGGGAIAENPFRSLTLGADVAVSNLDEADSSLQELGGVSVLGEPVPLREDALLLDAEAGIHASAAMAALSKSFPALKGYNSRQLSRTSEDLAYIARFAAAALLVEDPTVWTSFASWQRVLLGARDVPQRAFTAGVEAISNQIASQHPEAAELLNRSLANEGGGKATPGPYAF